MAEQCKQTRPSSHPLSAILILSLSGCIDEIADRISFAQGLPPLRWMRWQRAIYVRKKGTVRHFLVELMERRAKYLGKVKLRTHVYIEKLHCSLGASRRTKLSQKLWKCQLLCFNIETKICPSWSVFVRGGAASMYTSGAEYEGGWCLLDAYSIIQRCRCSTVSEFDMTLWLLERTTDAEVITQPVLISGHVWRVERTFACYDLNNKLDNEPFSNFFQLSWQRPIGAVARQLEAVGLPHTHRTTFILRIFSHSMHLPPSAYVQLLMSNEKYFETTTCMNIWSMAIVKNACISGNFQIRVSEVWDDIRYSIQLPNLARKEEQMFGGTKPHVSIKVLVYQRTTIEMEHYISRCAAKCIPIIGMVHESLGDGVYTGWSVVDKDGHSIHYLTRMDGMYEIWFWQDEMT